MGCGTLELGLEPDVDLGQENDTITTEQVIVPPATPGGVATQEPFSYDSLPTGLLLDLTLAGLVYHDGDGVWVVDSQGQSRFIAERTSYPVLSPDGTQVLYTTDQEIVLWLLDLTSGETRMLDDTPGMMKRSYTWWPERPDVIVYEYSKELDPYQGSLGALNLDTGEYTVLDADYPTYFVLSPDGETIALGARESLRLYTWGAETEYISAADYGLEDWSLSNPVWSPDGTRLSLIGSRYNEIEVKSEISVFVLDIQSRTAATIHFYQANLGGEFGFTTSWSPDGEWMTATLVGELGGRYPSVWILRTDGSEKHQFGYAANPLWSPDGSRIVFWQGPEPGSEDTSYLAYNIFLVEIGVWENQPLTTPPGSFAEDWVELP
jgi:Tol biopolymer transport system component